MIHSHNRSPVLLTSPKRLCEANWSEIFSPASLAARCIVSGRNNRLPRIDDVDEEEKEEEAVDDDSEENQDVEDNGISLGLEDVPQNWKVSPEVWSMDSVSFCMLLFI